MAKRRLTGQTWLVMDSNATQPSASDPANRGLVHRVGPIDVDTAKSIGYFGGIGVAVALEIIEWPVGLFIAGIPFVKMLNRPGAPKPVRFVAHVFDGMAKPVGGDSEGTVRLAPQPPPPQIRRPRARARPRSA